MCRRGGDTIRRGGKVATTSHHASHKETEDRCRGCGGGRRSGRCHGVPCHQGSRPQKQEDETKRPVGRQPNQPTWEWKETEHHVSNETGAEAVAEDWRTQNHHHDDPCGASNCSQQPTCTPARRTLQVRLPEKDTCLLATNGSKRGPLLIVFHH